MPYMFNAWVFLIECKMVTIISIASQAQARNDTNPIVRHMLISLKDRVREVLFKI